MIARSLFTLCGSLVLVAQAPAQVEAKAVIEKAVEAHGGAERLNRFQAGQVQQKGALVLRKAEVPFVSATIYQFPDRVKNTIEYTTEAGPRAITQVLNGNRVGVFIGGVAQQVLPAQAEEMRQSAHVRAMMRLTPLLKDGKYRLAATAEKEVAGKLAAGIRVSADGYRDVRLYFDKETNLLTALERQTVDSEGKPVEQQEVFSDYRDAEGMKYHARTVVYQAGQRYISSEVVSFKPLPRVDAKEFSLNP